MLKYWNGLLGWWHRQSIERTLPATFTLLLVLLVSFYVFSAFRAVERSTLEAAQERTERVSQELAKVLVSNNQRRATVLEEVGTAPEFMSVLSPQSTTAGRETQLRRLAVPTDSSAILLLTSDLEPIAHIGRSVSAGASSELARPARDALERKNKVHRGRFFMDGGTPYYWTVMAIADSAGRSGFVAQLIRISNPNQTRSNALDEVMGGARVFFTNAGDADETWLEMEGRPAAPPLTRDERDGAVIHRRADGDFLAHSAPIADTPWLIVTEMPIAAARARAVAFVRDTAPLALALVLLGAVLAWLIAHRYAVPMRALARGAQAIAAGDYTQQVSIARKDELGRLGVAFNQMAREVQSSDSEVRRVNAELEHRVRSRTAELESVNQELRAFSYSVSHDLRSPLRSIDGFSQALLDEYDDSLDEKGKDYLRRVRAGAQRMGLLIDDLLLLSKVTLHPIVRTDVDITKIAREVVEDLIQADPARAVDITVQDGMRAYADRGLMRIALQNLISNAWKFTARADNPRIEVGSTPAAGATEYYVRDNGAGFDMAYASKLFSPFQRLHSEREFKGTGIGLATVHRVLSRHGGTIRAESAVGRGATFFFSVNGEAGS